MTALRVPDAKKKLIFFQETIFYDVINDYSRWEKAIFQDIYKEKNELSVCEK